MKTQKARRILVRLGFIFAGVCIRIGVLERITVYEVEKIYESCYFSGWFWDKDQ